VYKLTPKIQRQKRPHCVYKISLQMIILFVSLADVQSMFLDICCCREASESQQTSPTRTTSCCSASKEKWRLMTNKHRVRQTDIRCAHNALLAISVMQ